ncbi:RNA polymerase sigma factor YlaC [Lachnospiraceae bacterium]|nr:RNA polymerase sigma factor YlaC [Lachnospiraceae bacterium]
MYRDIEDLYSEYYQELYKYIYLMTLNKYDTEDILHNTFIKVMKGIKSFKNQSTIKTWLFFNRS